MTSTTATGTRVQYTKGQTSKVGTIEDTFTDWHGNLCIKVRWDGASRRSNVMAENVTPA